MYSLIFCQDSYIDKISVDIYENLKVYRCDMITMGFNVSENLLISYMRLIR